jgi:beta-glucanase (GH16 family)
MLSEKMIPEIDILKLDGKKKIGMNNYWGLGTNKSISKIGASKYLNDFFIFSLEWSEDKIVWKINDVIVKEQTSGIPKTPMYIVFSSALYNEISDSILPAKMDIDWIKCYSKN